MTSPDRSQNIDSPVTATEKATEQAIEALRQQSLTLWWQLTVGVWLTIGPLTLWQLRSEISLLLDYFTWTSVYYGLKYNFLGSLGFFFCVGLTITLLVREVRHLVLGLSPIERKRLEKQLTKIRLQGASHPLWSLVNHATHN
ncbi:hypothetical protein [Leptothoe sp. PORK10 BA2]|uniref:hypothetical protein n=1 Tax=Leptothoe sp. PORK10 BA2 TaxID=3110254 RepID=UPI002B1ED869|nr:hypothetical protein [Leptothoe sp. PORK10 BA2]MEA5462349.1 hypothetical protein [Leptothoe sp. PORK10 BA2]